MKKKKITVSIDSTYKYLQIWNGIFNLTNKELQILSTFIDVQTIKSDANLCSVKNKKEVAMIVGIDDHNTLNNYIKRFKDKGAMLKKENAYKLNPFLNPNTDKVEVTINRK
jgi:hypothetical protein|tara:strand:+ start:836 stop:1168 length:333 start_codon:yes stop_codon:yes gene_type:complete